jgi:hypothetical protein
MTWASFMLGFWAGLTVAFAVMLAVSMQRDKRMKK